ncbi:SUMF1/EgtB/PvdO family nonheme iron enzyme [Mastigocladopsis repens]|uniref:SUMF1/EgtB/PvdO family nonheme iron enzyme n=1 Tax=Mastigocladopsis repens TaxID=221287 RepID=UPI0002EF4FC8|nr:SUMF1/EgtB/PvdO family nonheme iron enzyme [Mastigocladopsis repens]
MGKNWAIVVGINNYDNLQPLKYAKRDAEVMAKWLREEAQFESVFLFTEDSPPIPTTPPIQTQPTFGRLRRFLQAQFENTEKPLLKPEDNFWFFFAGHGRRSADQDYLMLSDSDPTDVEHTALSVDYITQRLRRSGADNVVLFLDACRDQGSRGGLGIGIDEHQGVITFYSCTAHQQSWEIDELQHGSFTYTLLAGLRLQGEANCATVERLYEHLKRQVPQVNADYRKPKQNPYLKAEPPHKMYYILLEQSATLKDVQPLKYQASLAENRGDLSLAKQLWVRVLAASRGDWDAVDAIERIVLRQRGSSEPIISISEPMTSLRSGERSVTSEPTQESQIAQQAKAHRQNLVRYKQDFTKAIEQEFPLGESTRGRLRNLQQSLQLSNEEISQIEQPIIVQKEAEYRKRQEEERIRQQQEAERLRRQQQAEQLKQQEVERRRQQQATTITTPLRISRKRFLQLAGLGGAGLVTAVIGHEIYKPISLQSFNFEVVTVDERGKEINRRPGQAKFFSQDLGNNVTLEMVEIPAGSFTMGSPPGENGRRESEGPQHTVKVPTFFMGRFAVTQEQYQQVMGKNPSNFIGAKRPVEKVSWNDAMDFCKKLSQKTGRTYRLPSEAEWEYACRAGTTTPFHFGETLTTDLANYNGNYTYASAPKGEYRQQTTEVGSFPPNAFGLYDMHGNVWEWCQDNWHDNYKGAPVDGRAWVENDNQIQVLRGGSWYDGPVFCRSASRLDLRAERDDIDDYVGFRVVCAFGRTF